jgi:tryptophan halogenase
LLSFWPDTDFDPSVRDEYNRLSMLEFVRIRDFLILHYKLTQRDDGELWRYTANMPIPDSLQHRIDQFKGYGRVVSDVADLFGPPSWVAVHLGQCNDPQRHDPLIDQRPVDSTAVLRQLHGAMDQVARSMPTHAQFLAQYCKAEPVAMPMKKVA